mmetsp:Transcript_34024/g.53021  ORF Transcript_34024/g.53021 Transcript_34024/m.53021 type:complete len:212 (-) Transcript_34024:174-809(-)
MAGKRVQRGEVWLRGPNVSPGYFKNPKETAEVFDREGWLHTGDVGQWEQDGTLRIIDRKKNIFKLAQGEYVSPETCEAAIGTSKWVGQIWVHGSSFETCVVCVVVPDVDVIKKYGKDNSLGDNVAEIVAKSEVKQMIFDDMIAVSKSCKLRSFELPKDVHFETDTNELGVAWTTENDCATPTMKLKRPALVKRYQKLVDKMYADLKAAGKA